MEMLS